MEVYFFVRRNISSILLLRCFSSGNFRAVFIHYFWTEMPTLSLHVLAACAACGEPAPPRRGRLWGAGGGARALLTCWAVGAARVSETVMETHTHRRATIISTKLLLPLLLLLGRRPPCSSRWRSGLVSRARRPAWAQAWSTLRCMMRQLEGAATGAAAGRVRAQEGGARLSRSDFWPTPPAEDGFGLPILSAMSGRCVSVS